MFSQRSSHYWSQQSRTFVFKGFSARQQKKPKKAANYSVIEQNALSDKHAKMTGQNDRPDEGLTGQAHDQAGHCPLTGRCFEPCPEDKISILRVVMHESSFTLAASKLNHSPEATMTPKNYWRKSFSLWASSAIWVSEASFTRTRERGCLLRLRHLLARSRETCFARPNRRACSHARSHFDSQ